MDKEKENSKGTKDKNDIAEDKLAQDEETIDKLISKRRRDRNIKFILIIIIIILLFMLCILINRLGRIGSTSSDSITRITVSDDDLQITKDTELAIFDNTKFDIEDMIAPGSSGDYTFYITNVSNVDLTYDIAFSDIMSNPVNMMYKLKFNNVYICGNSEEYVDISSLNIDDIIIMADSTDMFTLEWCWIDDDEEDTKTGILSTEESREYYTLNLSIYVKSY